MGYDDFGDKFWPILGERVYEVDHDITKMIFKKAAEVAEGSHKETLKLGVEWQCGRTKICMKDSARLAIETVLNMVESRSAIKL